MPLKNIVTLAAASIALAGSFAPLPLNAQGERKVVMRGRCQYSDRVAQYRSETTLILCDTVAIDRSADQTILEFSLMNGSPTRFAGTMQGDRMTVSTVRFRTGTLATAIGTCELFHHRDGSLSVIACLAKTGSRSVAVNFVPSRL